jgi:hypothetical protein
MREVEFVVAHEPGANPVADLPADHPEARLRSLACHVTEASRWRVDRASGSAAALDALEAGYYETPPEVEADELGIPGSTLTYRRRRAEAWLAPDYTK